jgi:hypothetical protein
MILHQVDEKNVEILESIFAYLTPEGWVVPEWLKLLRATIRMDR